MFYCYKSFDFVDYLINRLDKLLNTNYIKDYRDLVSTLKITKKY